MRFLTSTLLVFLLSASLAWPETVIRLPVEKLPVGTVMIYEYRPGAIETRRVTMNDEQGLEMDVSRETGSRPIRYTLVFDSAGLTTRFDRQTGTDLEFEPHNCLRVIGYCQFTVTNSNGGTYPRTYSSELIDDVLVAKVMNESGHVLKIYELSFDEDGMLQEVLSGVPENIKSRLRLKEVIPASE